jgi:hypothetical protein
MFLCPARGPTVKEATPDVTVRAIAAIIRARRRSE